MDLRKKLEAELLPAEWKMLAMHQRREALFMVSAELTLLDAAVAVAANDSASVEAWLGDGRLARPQTEAIEVWQDEEGALFDMVIVQPYVLARRR